MIAREQVLATTESAHTATTTATAAGRVTWSFAAPTATPPPGTSSTAGMDVVPGSGMDVVQRYEYTGRELASESNEYYFRYRVYGPELGQFFTRDPWVYWQGMAVYPGWFAWHGVRDPSGRGDDPNDPDKQDLFMGGIAQGAMDVLGIGSIPESAAERGKSLANQFGELYSQVTTPHKVSQKWERRLIDVPLNLVLASVGDPPAPCESCAGNCVRKVVVVVEIYQTGWVEAPSINNYHLEPKQEEVGTDVIQDQGRAVTGVRYSPGKDAQKMAACLTALEAACKDVPIPGEGCHPDAPCGHATTLTHPPGTVHGPGGDVLRTFSP